MLIIPVLDISQGHVVHAHKGMRDNYQPVQSRLTTGSDLHEIINAFLSLYPFEIIYIADLDAIQGHAGNRSLIKSLPGYFPGICFWVDAGATPGHDLPYHGVKGFQSILGSENRLSFKDTSRLLTSQPEPVLSLDFSDYGLIGDQKLLQNPEQWPRRIIAMTIHRVGSSSGPDFEKIQTVLDLAPSKQVFAAGGIRDEQDIENLNQCGVAGILIATALHDLTITYDIISSKADKKMPR